jgi:hypothetical protein
MAYVLVCLLISLVVFTLSRSRGVPWLSLGLVARGTHAQHISFLSFSRSSSVKGELEWCTSAGECYHHGGPRDTSEMSSLTWRALSGLKGGRSVSAGCRQTTLES